MENYKNIFQLVFKRLESMIKKQKPEQKPKPIVEEIQPVIDDAQLVNSARAELVQRLNLPDSISGNNDFKKLRQDIKGFSNLVEISEEMELPFGAVKPNLIQGEIKTRNGRFKDFLLFRLEDEALNIKNLTLVFKNRRPNNDIGLIFDPKERFNLYQTSIKTDDGISRSVEFLRLTETDRVNEINSRVSYYDASGNWLLTDYVQEEKTKEAEKKFTHAFIMSESAYSYNFNFPMYLKHEIYDESLLKHFPCKPLLFKFLIGKFESFEKVVNPLTFLNDLPEKDLKGIKTTFENNLTDYQKFNRKRILRDIAEAQTLKSYVEEEHNLTLN